MIWFLTDCNQNKTFEKAATRHRTRYGTRLSSRIHKNSDREAAILNNFLLLSTYLNMELTRLEIHKIMLNSPNLHLYNTLHKHCMQQQYIVASAFVESSICLEDYNCQTYFGPEQMMEEKTLFSVPACRTHRCLQCLLELIPLCHFKLHMNISINSKMFAAKVHFQIHLNKQK